MNSQLIFRVVRRGFTLVELLVVIGIIAILSALLFPAFRAATSSAKRSACIHNLQLVAQATALAHDEGDGYPVMPNFIGGNGIPQGGVTQLALTRKQINAGDLWCPNDKSTDALAQYIKSKLSAAETTAYQDIDGKFDEERFRRDNGLLHDTSNSSYAFSYNYYGYVTTTNGLPFPITSPRAALFFMADPALVSNADFAARYFSPLHNVSSADFTEEWDLQLIKNYLPDSASGEIVPHGMFQGLRNNWAPQRTPIAYCLDHLQKNQGSVPVAMLSGEAVVVAMPESGASTAQRYSGAYPRNGADGYIDWRINKAAISSGAQNNNMLSDTPAAGDVNTMPLVQANYRRFSIRDLKLGDHWYNTGIAIRPGAMVMVLAHARWAWAENTLTGDFANKAYAELADGAGYLWFSADGDPVELAARSGDNPALPMPEQAVSQLIGRIGNSAPFSLKSRGDYFNAGDSGTLLLSSNQSAGSFAAIDRGWCEVWIAVYQQ